MNNNFREVSETSPTFCVLPWIEMVLNFYSLYTPCCIAKPIKDENGRYYTLVDDPLEDYWNSYGLREIRRKMLAGEKVEACYWCYYDESVKKTSKRQGANEEWLKQDRKEILNRVEKSRINNYKVEVPPISLDIHSKNLCNLKCRMCTPVNSSKIEQEHRELIKSDMDTSIIEMTDSFKIDKRLANWGGAHKKVWESVYKWTPGLKKLWLMGGEPTLIKENWDFVDYLKEKGYSKNINLDFNTNCTQNPDKLIATFEDFRFVEIRFSIDGYREVQEYIRYPSKWKEIENNVLKMLKSWRKNVYFYFAPVVQIYNILDIVQLLKWIDELRVHHNIRSCYLRMCIEPNFLNIAILPKNVKTEAFSQIETYKNNYKGYDLGLLNSLGAVENVLKSEEKPDIGKDLRSFYRYTKLLDQHRGNSFEKIFPELNRLLNEDGRWKS